MTNPEGGKVEDAENPTETTKLDTTGESAANMVVENEGDDHDNIADDSKVHLINANGGAGGGDVEVKIIDGTTTPSEAEVSFTGLGKDEVMKYADEPFWKRLRTILFILFWIGWIAMLVTAIAIIVMAPRCPPRPDLKWYQTDSVYEVLPESFKDDNGDGKGDYEGLKDKSDYIFDDLGAHAIWIRSMYKTDGMDSGRGVEDHKEVADWFDTTPSKMKSWMKDLLKEGKRIILDLIPNQTSKKHAWFEKSKKKEGKYDSYYIWATSSTGQPPNAMKNVNGEPAWTLDPDRNEWYFHQFDKDHPDLNLQNPDVTDEIEDIMKFWLDAGVAGFHVQDVEYLLEDKDLANVDASKSQRNNNGTLGFLARLRKIIDDYSDKPGKERVLFATLSSDTTKDEALAYWGPKEDPRLHIVAPVMDILKSTTTAEALKMVLEKYLVDDRYQWMGYAMGGPNTERLANRMENTVGLTIAHALQFLLPGTPFNYYGDEFGQRNVDVPANRKPEDKYRTPLQWDSSKNAGFSTHNETWLPVGDDYKTNHVAAGTALFSEDTPLKAVKDLIELREEESLQFGKTKLCAQSDLFAFTRKAERFPYFLTLINMGDKVQTFHLEELDCVTSKADGTMRFHSREDTEGEVYDFHEHAIMMEKGDVVVIEFSAE